MESRRSEPAPQESRRSACAYGVRTSRPHSHPDGPAPTARLPDSFARRSDRESRRSRRCCFPILMVLRSVELGITRAAGSRPPGKQALRACAHSTRSNYTFSIPFPKIYIPLRFTGHQGVHNRIDEMLIAFMIGLVNRTQ